MMCICERSKALLTHRYSPPNFLTSPSNTLSSSPLLRLLSSKSSLRCSTHPIPHSNPSVSEPGPSISQDFLSWILTSSNSKSLKGGIPVHTPVIKLNLHDNLFLNNNLLSVYAKCFGPKVAHKLFDEMFYRDVVSWTALLSAYVREKYYEVAIGLYDCMIGSGFTPNEFTFSSVLRSCASIGDLRHGACVQAQIVKRGFGSNLVLQSSLADFYSKCRRLDEAYEVFSSMDDHDMVSWTMMISAFVQAEDWIGALKLYSDMLKSGVPPNEFTFVKLLMACGFVGEEWGKMVHAHLISWGIELNLILKTALVDMYFKCKRKEDALKISSQTPDCDVLLWTAMISGYNQASCCTEAITVFQRMDLAGISPNSFTFAAILNVCSSMPSLLLGRQIHSRVFRAGLNNDVSVGNALVHIYMTGCSDSIKEALLVFKEMVSPNVISWTTLIGGLAQHGHDHEAFQAFTCMQVTGVQPNSFTLSSLLKGCRTLDAMKHVRMLHGYILKTNADCDMTVGNSLVDIYGKFGMVDEAWCVINTMYQRDAVTYTSLAAGMNQIGHHKMALGVMLHMLDTSVNIDGFSMASFLSATASLATIQPGKQLHCYSIKSGLINQISVSNGLVDMYGKCGSISDAQRVFQAITEPNVVSWNGLISGLASNGHFSAALSYFEEMKLVGVCPDEITFLLVLFACSHGGLVDLGVENFKLMSEAYGISPQYDHYVCFVDLLGRAGRLEEAASTIQTMPFKPDALIYKTLLGSCKVYKNLTLGEYVAGCALELDPSDPAVYMLLSNMYDDAGKPDLTEQTRQMMRNRGLRKNLGQSWMEIRNKVYLFTAGDRSNPQINEIHWKIDSLMQKINGLGCGYVADPSSPFHSEKLALAFGLLNTPSAAPLRIIKNIRICDDCHNFMKLVTNVLDREIVVRDGNRFHFFKNGDCSCGGFW